MSVFDEFDVFRNILESLLTGVCVVDTQKRIVFWSEGAEHITGRLRHEVIGHSCVREALLHCQQSGCEFCSEECPLARAIKTARSVEGAGFFHHKSGYEVPVRIRAVPVHNQHGSIIGAVETFDELEQRDSQPREKVLAGCLDDLTGLASRAQMNSHLRDALAAYTEREVAIGVLLFRMEGLERFRASFGPDAASSLLCVIAHSLATEVWRTDIVGRWANDEFLVILNGCNGESLPGVRERLRRVLANDAIEWWGERRSLRVSIGETTARPDDTVESILDRAQKSLDHASRWLSNTTGAGKNESSES
jgi:diguanylate cyclase (GGDEF)-like protein/PAS domain S-box-containing protein